MLMRNLSFKLILVGMVSLLMTVIRYEETLPLPNILFGKTRLSKYGLSALNHYDLQFSLKVDWCALPLEPAIH